MLCEPVQVLVTSSMNDFLFENSKFLRPYKSLMALAAC